MALFGKKKEETPAPAVIDKAKSQAALEKGQELHGEEDYASAIIFYNEAAKHNPANAEIYEWRCTAHNFVKDYDNAIKDATEAIRLNPDTDEMTYKARGEAYLAKKDYAKAIADLEKAILINPDDGDSHELLKEAQALASGSKFGAKPPKSARLLSKDGWNKCCNGKYAEGIQMLSEAIALEPSNSEIRYWYGYRGEGYRLNGQTDLAIKDLTQAITLDMSSPWPYEKRGDAYMAKKEYAKAIADYEKNKATFPYLEEKIAEAKKLLGKTAAQKQEAEKKAQAQKENTGEVEE